MVEGAGNRKIVCRLCTLYSSQASHVVAVNSSNHSHGEEKNDTQRGRGQISEFSTKKKV